MAILAAEYGIAVQRVRIGGLHRNSFGLHCADEQVAREAVERACIVPEGQQIVRLAIDAGIVGRECQAGYVTQVLLEVRYVGGAGPRLLG